MESLSSWQVLLVCNTIAALFIGTVIGEKRKIGAGWTIFFCITLSTIIGLAITIASPSKKNDKAYLNKKPDISLVIIAILFIMLGMYSIISAIIKLFSNHLETPISKNIEGIILGVGFIGWGIYIIRPPKIKLQINDDTQNIKH